MSEMRKKVLVGAILMVLSGGCMIVSATASLFFRQLLDRLLVTLPLWLPLPSNRLALGRQNADTLAN